MRFKYVDKLIKIWNFKHNLLYKIRLRFALEFAKFNYLKNKLYTII